MTNKFKYALVEIHYEGCKKEDKPYWFLYIENYMDLHRYFEQQQPKMVKQYFEIKKKKKFGHCTSDIERAVETVFMVNNNNRKTLLDDLYHISDIFSKPKIKMVMDGKKLLINPTGIGFCPYNEKTHTIIKVVEKEDYNFPDIMLDDTDIKISKWEGGKHWYIKIGNHQMDGRFNTYEYAKDASTEFLKKLNKEFKSENK